MGKVKGLMLGFGILLHHFSAVSASMVQKYIANKGEIHSCNKSVVITDFEIGGILINSELFS